MDWERHEHDYQEWTREWGGENWTPTNCFAVFLIIVVFWGVVIGGGFWLANAF